MTDSLELWHQERLRNWGWYFEKIADILVRKFKPENILDIGCSDGLLLSFFHTRGLQCYGVDISKKSIMFAPEEIKENLMLLDIEKEYLPFKDNTFECITILEVLEHLHDHSLIISEMYRVLKPGGIVLMSSPVNSKLYQTISKTLSKPKRSEPDNSIKDFEVCEFSPHINVHSKKFWIKEFKSAGFELLEDFKKANKNLIMQVIDSHDPRDGTAKLLMKFGKIGKFLRKYLAYHLWSTTLIFVKQ